MSMLEEKILDCWQIVDDLDILLELSDNPSPTAKDLDRVQNILIGMKTLYQFKFEKLFKEFEDQLHPNAEFDALTNIMARLK